MLKVWTYVSSRLAALKRDERGVTALEYGVIAAFIIVAIIAALAQISGKLNSAFTSISTALPGAPGSSGP